MIIELIRQFYDLPRCFRILGEKGSYRFVKYGNKGIRSSSASSYRLPLFDVEVSAGKASPYSKMSQNELALQFFSAGLFDPRISDQALACIDMMDFDRKQFVRDKIAGNGESYKKQQLVTEAAAAAVKSKKELPEAEGESRVTKEARTRAANASVPG